VGATAAACGASTNAIAGSTPSACTSQDVFAKWLGTRSMRVYIPPSPPRGAGYPVMFFFHGISSASDIGMQNFKALSADPDNPDPFIIVSAQGLPRTEVELCVDEQDGKCVGDWMGYQQFCTMVYGGMFDNLCFAVMGSLSLRGWDLSDPGDDFANNEDLVLLRDMLVALESSLTRRPRFLQQPCPAPAIDRSRIYLTGHSMGGFFSHLAGQYAEQVLEDVNETLGLYGDHAYRLAGIGTGSAGLTSQLRIYDEKQSTYTLVQVPGGFDFLEDTGQTQPLVAGDYRVMLLADMSDPAVSFEGNTSLSIERYLDVWPEGLFEYYVYDRGGGNVSHKWHPDYADGTCTHYGASKQIWRFLSATGEGGEGYEPGVPTPPLPAEICTSEWDPAP
jgi:hypothetical protein